MGRPRIGLLYCIQRQLSFCVERARAGLDSHLPVSIHAGPTPRIGEAMEMRTSTGLFLLLNMDIHKLSHVTGNKPKVVSF